MKIKTLTPMSLAVTVLATAVNVGAETWNLQVVIPTDSFAPETSHWSAVIVDPYSDPATPASQSVFAGGQIYPALGAPTFRLDPSPTWPDFTWVNIACGLDAILEFAHNSGDGLYSAGYALKEARPGKYVSVWKVQRSSDADLGDNGTWSDADNFSLSKSYSTAYGITTDSQGTVYVSGAAQETGGIDHWIVRRKRTGENQFTTVYDVKNKDSFNFFPRVCTFPGNGSNPKPAVFTFGNFNYRWTVLRSQQSGEKGTWTTVDTWADGPAQSTANAAAYDPNSGKIYVVGSRGLGGNRTAWVVRMSAKGGDPGSWVTLLDAGSTPPNAPQHVDYPTAVLVDSSGAVWVQGVITLPLPNGAATTVMKIIRCTAPSSKESWLQSFATNDLLTSGDGQILPFGNTDYSWGASLAADSVGNLFAAGAAHWNADYRLNLVRISPGTTP